MDSIVAAANHILTKKWRGYSDPEVNIFSDTDGIPQYNYANCKDA